MSGELRVVEIGPGVYVPEVKGWFLWHRVFLSSQYKPDKTFPSIEDALDAAKERIRGQNTYPRVVWP